jgi:hypothetical protein
MQQWPSIHGLPYMALHGLTWYNVYTQTHPLIRRLGNLFFFFLYSYNPPALPRTRKRVKRPAGIVSDDAHPDLCTYHRQVPRRWEKKDIQQDPHQTRGIEWKTMHYILGHEGSMSTASRPKFGQARLLRRFDVKKKHNGFSRLRPNSPTSSSRWKGLDELKAIINYHGILKIMTHN